MFKKWVIGCWLAEIKKQNMACVKESFLFGKNHSFFVRILLLTKAVFIQGTCDVAAFGRESIPERNLLSLTAMETMELAVFLGAVGAVVVLAVFCLHQHILIAQKNRRLCLQIADLTALVRKNEWLLQLKEQCTLIWSNEGMRKTIEIIGTLPSIMGAPKNRRDFLSFELWLTTQSSGMLDNAVRELHESGRGFRLVVETQTGALLDVEGFRGVTYVLARFVSLSGEKETSARLRLENQNLQAEYETVFRLLKKIQVPFWIRHENGSLKWVNEAYAEAVESLNPSEAIEKKRELLGTPAREQIARCSRYEKMFDEHVSTVVGGDRRIYRVMDCKGDIGRAGIAIDLTEMEADRKELERLKCDHAEILNRIATAVASFDSAQKLRFFNEAFRCLWQLEASFLDSAPDHALLLDRLRSEGKIAERPEWRRWKAFVLGAYRKLETQEDCWHLPDSRTIRVIANPQSDGGVTWMFENLTEKIDLESRYNAAIKVQAETLDNLAEGVAVFGSDGKMKLFNSAFLRLWNLKSTGISVGTHITAIREHCENFSCEPVWRGIVEDVTGCETLVDDRYGQIALRNGKILRYGLIHLPNGQKMLTCVDVTDSVHIERALKEKNEALEKADTLKNNFIQHVSYELRSPLTNIIGFTDLMKMPDTGNLNKLQREYLQHISSSSGALCTIINDILDLATVDAGIMELEISKIDVRETIFAAAAPLKKRMKEKNIRLKKIMKNAPERFFADPLRSRQIIYNLLGNAVNYAPVSSVITLECRTVPSAVEFRIHDDGPGISPEVIRTVFERFESGSIGGRRRGAGLGLAIVKSFIELHGGEVVIETAAQGGTTVLCSFPSSDQSVLPKREEALEI